MTLQSAKAFSVILLNVAFCYFKAEGGCAQRQIAKCCFLCCLQNAIIQSVLFWVPSWFCYVIMSNVIMFGVFVLFVEYFMLFVEWCYPAL